MKVELFYFEGCPNHPPAMEMLREILTHYAVRTRFTKLKSAPKPKPRRLDLWVLPAFVLMAPTSSRGHVPQKTLA